MKISKIRKNKGGFIPELIRVMVVLLLTSSTTVFSKPKFDKEEYKEDFEQLMTELSQAYGNLIYIVEDRKIDLSAMRENTLKDISNLTNMKDGRKLLNKFIKQFSDPHLRLVWPKEKSDLLYDFNAPEEYMDTSAFCKEVGYTTRKNPGVSFRYLEDYLSLESSDSDVFPAGVLDLGKTKVGVIRIDYFMPTYFPLLCADAVKSLNIDISKSCGDDCWSSIDFTADDLLTKILERQINELVSRDIDAILIDITNNGGGTSWVKVAERVLTPVKLNSSRVGNIIHPHQSEHFNNAITTIEEDLASPQASHEKLLLNALDKYKQASQKLTKPCDRSNLWLGKTLECELVDNSFFTTGAMQYANPGELSTLKSSGYLFSPSDHEYEEGLYAGPLYVLTNNLTASAAEEFTAILQDNNAATIIGQPTMGAGCGYTNGGIDIELKHTKAKLLVPDCVRFRKDGTNEVVGIEPDILIPWRQDKRIRDNEYLIARRVKDKLLEVIKK